MSALEELLFGATSNSKEKQQKQKEKSGFDLEAYVKEKEDKSVAHKIVQQAKLGVITPEDDQLVLASSLIGLHWTPFVRYKKPTDKNCYKFKCDRKARFYSLCVSNPCLYKHICTDCLQKED